MPLATDQQVANFIRDFGPIRLGCRGEGCCNEDYDGVHLLPGDRAYRRIVDHGSVTGNPVG